MKLADLVANVVYESLSELNAVERISMAELKELCGESKNGEIIVCGCLSLGSINFSTPSLKINLDCILPRVYGEIQGDLKKTFDKEQEGVACSELTYQEKELIKKWIKDQRDKKPFKSPLLEEIFERRVEGGDQTLAELIRQQTKGLGRGMPIPPISARIYRYAVKKNGDLFAYTEDGKERIKKDDLILDSIRNKIISIYPLEKGSFSRISLV